MAEGESERVIPEQAEDDGAGGEIKAIGTVYAALKPLKEDAQRRVLDYVLQMLGLRSSHRTRHAHTLDEHREEEPPLPEVAEPAAQEESETAGLEGVSPAAQRWMKRSGLSEQALSEIFSLGLDEIDLVAKKIPGKNKKEILRSVLLLKGIAGYLSTGTARLMHKALKEAAVHYQAYDQTNFATNMKSFAGEVGGTKATGYTLTARGIAEATKLLQAMTKNADESDE